MSDRSPLHDVGRVVLGDVFMMRALARCYGLFACHPDERGVYVVHGDVDRCTRANDALIARARVKHLTPVDVRAYFLEWTTTLAFFSADAYHAKGIAALVPGVGQFADALMAAYEPATTVLIQFFVTSARAGQTHVLTRCFFPEPSLDKEQRLRAAVGARTGTPELARCAQPHMTAVLADLEAKTNLQRTLDACTPAQIKAIIDEIFFDDERPPSTPGGDRHHLPLHVLSDDTRRCRRCRRATTTRCGACKLTFFCSRACQRARWRTHNRLCNLVFAFGAIAATSFEPAPVN